MLCRNCSAEISTDAASCEKCGAVADGSNPVPIASITETPSAEISTPVPGSPPYATFTALTLGLGVCLSVLVFGAADNLAHYYWHVSWVAVLAFASAIAFLAGMPRAWRRIESKDDDVTRQKRLLKMCFFFVSVFVLIAAVVGVSIGKNGRESAQTLADIKEIALLNKRIGAARASGDKSLAAQIEIYKALDPDVESYDEIASRLEDELPAYDARFPIVHSRTMRNLRSVQEGRQRMELIRQEIDVARDIELLDPATQLQRWHERMQPLLDAEAQLRTSGY